MGCTLLLRQLMLLLWKNFLLQFRRPIGTIFEILLPSLALLALVGLRQIPGVTDLFHTCAASFRSTDLPFPDYFSDTRLLYYTPNTTITNAIMAEAERAWPQLANRTVAVADQETIAQLIESNQSYADDSFCFSGSAGVYFDRLEEDGKDIAYTLRFPYEQYWYTNERAFDLRSTFLRTESTYTSEGFMSIQRILDETIIRYFANKTEKEVPDIFLTMRQFPFPKTATDFFLVALSFGLSILVVISFLYTAATITKELVIEKESRIRESMLMMGLRQWVLWASWFIKQFIFMFIWVVAYTILFKYARVWPRSDGFLLFIFFLLYIISIIAYGFLLSVWFNSPRIALIVSFLVFFITYVPALFILPFTQQIPYGGKLALALFSNTAFSLGVTVISEWEQQQLGLQWNNVADPISIENPLNMGAVFGMMICDIVLYMLIAWYVDAVKPGIYGVPKPLYFPFLPSYWTGKPTQTCLKRSAEEVESSGWHDPQAHEEEPTGLEAGIKIQNLTKIYDPAWFGLKRGEQLAVDELNVSMYEGQITALLGHNGAGKTTTISILTGLYTPTSGTAVINGYDIRTNMGQIRQSLGICPQHNVLFDRLTVYEHLKLFAILKGMPFNEVEDEVNSMLRDLLFQDKRKSAARNLSGGMKRKLSVGIALIGGSKTVVLDEPTSGMDPYARRATWDLLAKHKEGRTMLLTTHFMDEADLLGDRIAIMADGRLMCSGSSLFLKKRYGVGYHLTLVKGRSCDTQQLRELIMSTVPGSELASDVSAELTFLLPFTSSQHFPTLLDTLERDRDRLGLSSFGMSQTTMEEVFLKTGAGSNENFSNSTGYQQLTSSADDTEKQREVATERQEEEITVTDDGIELQEISDEPNTSLRPTKLTYERHTGPVLWIQQFVAMFLKRFYNSLRYYIALITQLVLPLIFIILALLIVKLPNNSPRDDPKRVLTLSRSSLSDEAKVFWAEFGEIPSQFSFQDIRPSDIHATSLDNITDDIRAIRDSVLVQNYTDIQDCCNYKFQLLDKFCASREARDLEDISCGSDFAFRRCPNCLRCYVAAETGASLSCISAPSLSESETGHCPAPPQVVLDDLDNPSGPLDSNNTYIAEYLLRRADDLVRSVFFQRYQAGFAFGYNEERPRDNNQDYCSLMGEGASGLESNITLNYMYGSSPSQLYLPSDDRNLTVTIWFNNQAFHTIAAALNAYHNVLLRNIMADNEWSITTYNHPLPRRLETQEDEETDNTNSGLSISVVATFGFTFFLSSFVIFPITEKESKAKHLQFVSGVNAVSYWLGNYAWDLINAAIVVIVSFCIVAAFQVDAFSGEYLHPLFWIMAFSCFASIPIAYCFSFLFKNHLWAYGLFFIFFYFPSLILQLTVFLFPSDTSHRRMQRDIIHYFSLLHPGYGLQIGIINIYRSGALDDFCTKEENAQSETCDNFLDNLFQFGYPGIGANLMYMAIEGVGLLFLIILIEYSFFLPLLKRFIYNRSNNGIHPEAPVSSGLDEDVRNEAMRVSRGADDNANNVVVIKNLSKVYTKYFIIPDKRAVNGISLAIPRGEFFGFVGVNGAGKTSTFSMLTGELSPSEGTAFVAGYDIRTDIRKVQQQIGYCPQFDALIERMTGRELLTMFARLRGIPERFIKDVVSSTINKLDLSKHANKQCGKYSGGNKRKLSTAIALIGDPPILFLDEPTTGMDPATRRYLWDVLTAVTREGRSIVLTSHSMEECEALCTRLTIMVNGEFKCLGSIQHLKSKFSDGYTLQAKVQFTDTWSPDALPPPDAPAGVTPPAYSVDGAPASVQTANVTLVNGLKQFIEQNFPRSVLTEEHQGSVTYQLPSAGLSWSSVFRQLEANKDALGIIDYSVSQTTLDQVFINFAKQQESSLL